MKRNVLVAAVPVELNYRYKPWIISGGLIEIHHILKQSKRICVHFQPWRDHKSYNYKKK